VSLAITHVCTVVAQVFELKMFIPLYGIVFKEKRSCRLICNENPKAAPMRLPNQNVLARGYDPLEGNPLQHDVQNDPGIKVTTLRKSNNPKCGIFDLGPIVISVIIYKIV
jgi:hypothetical protein